MMNTSLKKKKILGIIFLILLAGSGMIAWHVNDQIGSTYSGPVSKTKFAHIPYYNATLNEFVSPEKLISTKEKTTGGNPGFLRFFMKSPYAPKSALPSIPLSKKDFSKTPLSFAIYWLGHSTALLELDGHRILIDPIFENAGPLPGITKRFGASLLKREELPDIDVLLITHDHYDHLEAKTIKYFADMNIKFVVPLGIGARLRGWGVSEDKITELAWHQSYDLKGIKITASPAIHYSGRSNADRNKTLWASYVIQGRKKNIFWSGDTGYGSHFKQIGKKYGPFDVAFVEIDAWNNGWPNTHLFPDQVIKVVSDVKAKYLFPIHLATFDLALHPWNESIQTVSKLAESSNVALITPIMGQKVIPGVTQTEKWWKKQL
jgi:L-ascorbate metabolism protein UlaG (beta-lactamase superfamily)